MNYRFEGEVGTRKKMNYRFEGEVGTRKQMITAPPAG